MLEFRMGSMVGNCIVMYYKRIILYWYSSSM